MAMNEDRFTGTGKNLGGHIEQGFGRATDDVKTELEGKIKQATGAAQDVYEQAKDAAGDATRSVQEQAAPLEDFFAILSKTGRTPQWPWRSGLAGSSAAWAAVRITDAA